MNEYLKLYREMISLRGLTDHTVKSYSTYIRAYLDYLTNILKKNPEAVSWPELRDYIRFIQKERNLADRTINAAISQLRFFTIYVLHKKWDDCGRFPAFLSQRAAVEAFAHWIWFSARPRPLA